MDQDDVNIPLWHHISELRTTLLWTAAIIAFSFFICFFNSEKILFILQGPLQLVAQPIPESLFLQGLSSELFSQRLVLLGPLEGILMAFKMSFWVGLFASSPIWLFVILKFIFPGLKSHEKQLAIYFAMVSIGFAGIGILFAFYMTIPLANAYLLSFNSNLGLNLWSLENYLEFTLFLMLANGFAFELGAIGIFAVKLRVISLEMLVKKRRHAIVLSVILGALLTPPDILTQLLLAAPLVALYEGVILYARVLKFWRSDMD